MATGLAAVFQLWIFLLGTQVLTHSSIENLNNPDELYYAGKRQHFKALNQNTHVVVTEENPAYFNSRKACL